MNKRYSYDPACADLAMHFLQDSGGGPIDPAPLAQAIQDAVEDWFAALDAEKEQGK